jgi:curli biogenesis system outer membrane secretion channel CsgG
VLLLGASGPSAAQIFGPKATVTNPEGKGVDEAQQEAYDGPRARIAVARFADKTAKGWWNGDVGDGMADMLATALFHSNRYIVLERQTVGDVLREQDLGGAGRVKKGTEAAIGEIEGAELLITGTVTEFEGSASGGGGGLGGLAGGLGGLRGGAWGIGTAIIGAIAGAIKNAHMAIDVRVIDTRTSRIVAATSVEGKATDFNIGAALGGAAGGGALGGALGGWSKTPTEKALRICIAEAVKFIAAKTPPSYYRFKPEAVASGTAVDTGAVPAPPAAAAPPPGGAPGLPRASRALETIRSDFDRELLADLQEVKLRGVVLSAVINLRLAGNKPESEHVTVEMKSSVLDYDTGEMFPALDLDGFVSGRVKAGEVKTLRITFKAPKDAKKVGIKVSGIGTFEDVAIRP